MGLDRNNHGAGAARLCGSTDRAALNRTTCLKETQALGRMLLVLVDTYRDTITPETGDEAAAIEAATRAEEAIRGMMTKARCELVGDPEPDPVREFLMGGESQRLQTLTSAPA